jgi:hypothetical protein
MKKNFIDTQIETLAESQGISVEEAAELYKKCSDHLLDLDSLPKQNHSWTDRGLKYTCENAGHPWHEAWKVSKPMTKA